MRDIANNEHGGGPVQDDWSGKEVFTTGEAARVCNVSQQTIIRCFDSGRLTGFRVPGSRFRRIPRAELLRFMHDNGIPPDRLESGRKRILVIDDDAPTLALLREALGRDRRYEIQTAESGYDAGILTATFRPHLVIVDYRLPDVRGDLIVRRLREREDTADTRVICISGVVSQEDVDRLTRAGAEAIVRKPFNIERLGAKVAELLGVPGAANSNGTAHASDSGSGGRP
ncbi:MAG: response regulator [Phycisphaerales bacterium]|nr:response regulator [Phycisphaerales bacterium]